MILVLASQSPRRRELLRLITDDFESTVSDVEEICPPGLTAKEECSLFARQKCEAVASLRPDDVVIGSDTVVAFGSEVLGKPKDKDDARRMIRMLSGNTHTVYTAVCVQKSGVNHEFICETKVTFFPIPEKDIEEYTATPEPYDKAGGYGIHMTMSKYLDKLDGDYFSVMGLPVSRLFNLLHELEIV